ncbi:hypothetical protein [Nonomuraea sp. NPDC050643]|uniref:hypothetical protein n=1 Tax=Nonomuraea sp. NPDC050643 TaxID=3155660 RepID=UPI0033EEA73D
MNFHALTGHGDVYAASRDSGTYSNKKGVNLELWSDDLAKRQSFIAMDPPNHTQFRRLVSSGFTPRRVAELEPRIRQITRSYLHRALDARRFDFVADLAQNIPADVISELIGVPAVDRQQVLAWSNESLLRDEGTGAITELDSVGDLVRCRVSWRLARNASAGCLGGRGSPGRLSAVVGARFLQEGAG